MLFDPGIFLSRVFRRARGAACPAWGVGSTVRTSSAFVSAAHETRFHLPHVLDETPRHSSIRLQGMTLEESAPRKVLRPPTLEASHLLTGPTGCPGFEFSGLLRTIRRRARHCVSICRGFKYSVQIVESEHVVTDRASLLRTIRRRAGSGRRRPLSVPRMRPDFTYRMFSTKLRVIVPSGCRV